MGRAASWLLGKLGQVRTHPSCCENKGQNAPKPRAAQLLETPFDGVPFLENSMNIYSSKNLDIYMRNLLWRRSGLMMFHLFVC